MILQVIPIQQKRTGQLASGIKSSLLPTDYLVEINKVLLSMDDAELSLNTPELSTAVYEDFSLQEDALKVNLRQCIWIAVVNVEIMQGIYHCAFLDDL